jgi:exosortase
MTTNPDDTPSHGSQEAAPAAKGPGGLTAHGGSGRGDAERERRGGLGWLAWGFICLLWGYAIYRLGVFWHRYDDYSYGWFVPLLCLGLFWMRWNDRPRRDPVRAGSGTFLVLGLCALTLLPAILFQTVITQGRLAAWLFAVPVVAITLIALYFIGGRSYARFFLVPVLLLLLAVPWPMRVEAPLTVRMAKLNAAISTRVANHLGTPAVRSGVLIETGSGPVGRDSACSGIRAFQASLMISLFLGALFQLGFFRRALLLLGGVGIAFLCNVARTTHLVRTSDLKGVDAVNLYYDQAGFIILGITTAVLLVLAWALRRRADTTRAKRDEEGWGGKRFDSKGGERRTEKAADGGQPSVEGGAEKPKAEGMEPSLEIPTASGELPPVSPIGWLQTALIAVLAWLVVVEAGTGLWFGPFGKTSASQPVWSFKLPTQNQEFRLLPISKSDRSDLRFDEGRTAECRDAGGRTWKLCYLRWIPAASGYGAKSPDARQLESGEVGFLGAGMILQTNLGMQSLVINGVGIAVGMQRYISGGRVVHICRGYWKAGQANPDLTPERFSGFGVGRVFRALKSRDRGGNEERLIELGVWGIETDAEAQAAFRDCLAGMIGEAEERADGTEVRGQK